MTIDRHSPTWRAVAAWAAEARAQAAYDLIAPGLPPGPTEFARGRIAALDAVLGLAEPEQHQPPEPIGYDD